MKGRSQSVTLERFITGPFLPCKSLLNAWHEDKTKSVNSKAQEIKVLLLSYFFHNGKIKKKKTSHSLFVFSSSSPPNWSLLGSSVHEKRFPSHHGLPLSSHHPHRGLLGFLSNPVLISQFKVAWHSIFWCYIKLSSNRWAESKEKTSVKIWLCTVLPVLVLPHSACVCMLSKLVCMEAIFT